MRFYFTSDIHASDVCWRKFLHTPEYYRADVIVVGGDITGKSVVPIVGRPGAWQATFAGVRHELAEEEELRELERRVAVAGCYSRRFEPDEYEQVADDPETLDALFHAVVRERLLEWTELAEERYAGSGVRIIMNAGNDDFYDIDEILEASEVIEFPDRRVIDFEGFEMISLGLANETPWDCPRDVSEEELTAHLRSLAEQLNEPETAIFNIHVPPHATTIDLAPELDEGMNVVRSATGEISMVPVGSTAVREAILEYQPMLGLHGHIHQSPGVSKLGRTTVVNSGSEYQDGVLDGVILEIDRKRGVRTTQLVVG